MEFKKYFQFPLQRKYTKVLTKDWSMAFDFAFPMLFPNAYTPLDEIKDLVVDAINAGVPLTLFTNVKHEKGLIFIDDKEFILIRGWGYLTGGGSGALGLAPDIAVKIQDEFANYIVQILNGTYEA